MRRMTLIFILLITIFLGYFLLYKKPQQLPRTNAIIKDKDIYVEIADNTIKHAKGLSGRDKLNENEGMLFIFSTPHRPKFWMMGMNFGLDFIWLENGVVVDIHENITPQNLPPPNTISPKIDVNMVLEMNSGFVKKNKISHGDTFQLLD